MLCCYKNQIRIYDALTSLYSWNEVCTNLSCISTRAPHSLQATYSRNSTTTSSIPLLLYYIARPLYLEIFSFISNSRSISTFYSFTRLRLPYKLYTEQTTTLSDRWLQMKKFLNSAVLWMCIVTVTVITFRIRKSIKVASCLNKWMNERSWKFSRTKNKPVWSK